MSKVRLPLIPYAVTVIEESKKVVWPNRELVTKHTVMVLVSMLIAMMIFGSLDFGLKKLVILALGN